MLTEPVWHNLGQAPSSGQAPRLRSGQVTLEYLLLFAVIIVLTLLGVSTFDNDVRTSMETFVEGVSKTMSTPP